MTRKRQPINTAAGAVAVMKAAQRAVSPPAHVPLDEGDLPFWASVIAEFARSEWTEHQLELAAMLARSMHDLEREQRLLREEGSIAYSEKRTPIANPRKQIVQMLSGTILSMRRSLSLHARAQAGEAEKIGPRRAMAKAIEANNPLDDDLLGLPTLN